MNRLIISILTLSLLLTACSKEGYNIDPGNLVIGVWVFTDYQDGAQLFFRSNDFSNNHCYRFNSDGTLAERKNSGFCGTPPITYADYKGTWTILNDTLISINVGYWGGTTQYKMDIESVDRKFLKASLVHEGK